MSIVWLLLFELLWFSLRVGVIAVAAAGLLWFASRLFFERK